MKPLFPALLVAMAALPAHGQFWSELANPKVEVVLTHPPGLGIKVARVAFAPARDPQSRELADVLSADLVQGGRVEVVDRAHFDTLLREQELGASGYLDPATIARLGKLLGPTALVIVNVNRCEFSRNQATKEERHKDAKTQEEKVRILRTSINSLDFSATVQVVDLSTGRIFGAQRLEETPSLSATSHDGWPPYPRDSELRRMAYDRSRERVLRLLQPWDEGRKLTFFDDDVFGMKAAHERLEARDLRGALGLAREGLEASKTDKGRKPKYYPRTRYNLGIIHFIQGDYEEAKPLLREALDMQPDASIFKEAYRECLEAIRLQDELRSAVQAGTAAGSPPKDTAAPGNDAEARLKRLQDLFQKGLITEAEYAQKKAEILKDM